MKDELGIDWSQQHCGVIAASCGQVLEHMPDIAPVISTFPEDPRNFVWDVKVHMLMPEQFPCVPGWHCDNVQRVDGLPDHSKDRLDLPMYLWISGPPLTLFRSGFIRARRWIKFTQRDEHRCIASDNFTWRAFIRATHNDMDPRLGKFILRRHAQVYVSNAENYKW